jgi:hypothetical protein
LCGKLLFELSDDSLDESLFDSLSDSEELGRGLTVSTGSGLTNLVSESVGDCSPGMKALKSGSVKSVFGGADSSRSSGRWCVLFGKVSVTLRNVSGTDSGSG